MKYWARWAIPLALSLVMTAPSFAQDDGTPSARFNWSGIYFGGQVGFANADYASTLDGMYRDEFVDEQAYRNNPRPRDEDAGKSFAFRQSLKEDFGNADLKGAIGGVHVGVMAQWGSIVVGVEGQYNGVGIDGATNGDCLGLSTKFPGGTADCSLEVKSHIAAWLG